MPGGLTYNWNFGDGNTGTGSSIPHAYSLGGNFDVTLLATNSGGCSNSFTRPSYIHIHPLLTAAFNSATTHFCKQPAAVHFNNTTTGTAPLFYNWSLGDLSTSGSIAPNHTYTTAGSFNVTLRATDGNGCMDSVTATSYITVGSIDAGFTPVTDVCSGSDATFINTSTPHISSEWSFGEGGTSASETPTYNYSVSGIQTVRLIVFDGLCYDTAVHVTNVHARPVGTFTITPSLPCPTPVTMTYTATVPPGVTVNWELMDTFTATGSIATRLYALNKGRIDTVTMIMTDALGCTGSVYKIDTLFNTRAEVTATATGGCIPLTTVFSCSPLVTTLDPQTGDGIVVPSPYTITAYSWTFGDGSPGGTGAHPSHTYTAIGVYNIGCTMTTSNGCTMTAAGIVRAGVPPLSAAFSATPTHLCAGASVAFTGSVTGTYDGIKWDFAEIVDSPSTINILQKFTIPGIDTIRMHVYYHGCESLIKPRLPIFVDSPGADFTFVYTCTPKNGVAFTGRSLGATSQKMVFWRW